MGRAKGNLRSWFPLAAASKSRSRIFWRVLACFKHALTHKNLGWNSNSTNYQSITKYNLYAYRKILVKKKAGYGSIHATLCINTTLLKIGQELEAREWKCYHYRKLHKHLKQDLSEEMAQIQPGNVLATYQDSGKKSKLLCISQSLFPFSLCHWVACNC